MLFTYLSRLHATFRAYLAWFTLEMRPWVMDDVSAGETTEVIYGTPGIKSHVETYAGSSATVLCRGFLPAHCERAGHQFRSCGCLPFVELFHSVYP
jgi:hypothetical protein